MTDPHGNPNLLTAPADEKWKAIRKGVAVSFAFQNIKKKYPMVLDRVNTVISRAGALGPKASIDVDQLALRVTLDVIGLAGFGHDYKSVEKDEPEYNHLLRVLPRCFTEVMLRVINPIRPIFPSWFKTGPKGEPAGSPRPCAGSPGTALSARVPAPGCVPGQRPAAQPPPPCPLLSSPNPARPCHANFPPPGAAAFKEFQDQMRFLLNKVQKDGEPAADNFDIGAQVWRVLQEHPDISEDRMLSEIGMLFVEGFETTGERQAPVERAARSLGSPAACAPCTAPRRCTD
jgi:hypothetical protein